MSGTNKVDGRPCGRLQTKGVHRGFLIKATTALDGELRAHQLQALLGAALGERVVGGRNRPRESIDWPRIGLGLNNQLPVSTFCSTISAAAAACGGRGWSENQTKTKRAKRQNQAGGIHCLRPGSSRALQRESQGGFCFFLPAREFACPFVRELGPRFELQAALTRQSRNKNGDSVSKNTSVRYQEGRSLEASECPCAPREHWLKGAASQVVEFSWRLGQWLRFLTPASLILGRRKNIGLLNLSDRTTH
jgi:hypothetical protein